MKSKIITMAYFSPAVISLIFYSFLAIISMEIPGWPIWFLVGLLFASAVLMQQNKWWGCSVGLILGAVLIYMGSRCTGQVLDESLIGLIIFSYFAGCGLLCYKKGKQCNKRKRA